MINIFDSHAHLQSSSFDVDREDVAKRMREKEMGVINIGSNFESSKKGVELAEKYNNFFAVVGLHPHALEDIDDPEDNSFKGPEVFDRVRYIPFLENKKVVGIGECGLDYFKLTDEKSKILQKEVFRQQINLAKEYEKPLVLHIRSEKDNNAHKDALEILREEFSKAKPSSVPKNQDYGEAKGVCHFFTSNWSIAQQFLDLGFYISFSGVITFTNQYDEIVLKTPLDRILAETDCPYVAPVPHRGKRNEPAYVEYTIRKIAEIRGLSFEEVTKKTAENTMRLFGI